MIVNRGDFPSILKAYRTSCQSVVIEVSSLVSAIDEHVFSPGPMVVICMLRSDLRLASGAIRLLRWAIPKRGVAKTDTSLGN